MKQSVDLMNSMKLMNSRHSNTTTTTTSLARRALLLLTLLVMSVGNVWGQTFNGTLKTTGNIVNKYIKWDQTSAQFSISDLPTQLGTTLSVLKDAYYIKWYIVNGSDEKQTMLMGGYPQANWSVAVKDNPWPYQKDNDSNITAIYLHQGINFWGSDNLETKWTDWNLCQPTIYAPSGGTFETYKDYKVICVATNGSPTLNAYNTALMESEPDFDIQYVFHFNSTGLEPDDFVGSFSGTETPLSHEVTSRTETTTTIDMSGVLSTLPSAQYARFYLTQGGEAKDISATVISVTDGQTTSKDSRGVYLYTGSALTSSDLSAVTVNLPAGTYTNYQLVAVFSDDAPRDVTGTTVAQEPADLDVKYVYSFNYPTTVIDKYIDKNQNSSADFDITSLATDLGKSLSDINSSYYIRWRINDGTSDINFATSVYYNTWRITSPTDWSVPTGYSPSGQGDIPITYIYTGKSDLTSTLGTVGKLKVTAPGSDLFSDYPNYTVICEVFTPQPTIDGSGVVTDASVPALRYVFHFADAYVATSAELTTGMTVKREHNSKLTAELDLATSEHFDDVNGQFGNHLNDGTNVEKLYIRWYLADKEGNRVDVPAGITFAPVDASYADKIVSGINYGKVLHLGNAGAVVTADMLKMNVEVTDGDIDLNDYQVVCALGYADDGYTKEPTPLKVKYVYTFETPFEGKLAAGATTHTKEIIVNSDAAKVTIPINDYFSEILTDLSTTADDLARACT